MDNVFIRQVVSFEDSNERQTFLDGLRSYLSAIGLRMDGPTSLSQQGIKMSAVTKAKRQQILNAFFADIFALVRTRIQRSAFFSMIYLL